MAFNSSNPVSVGVATKKDHYDRAFDNTVALYGGSLALSGQAALDFVYATSATQLGRLAAQAGRFLRFNGASWEMADPIPSMWPVGSIFLSVSTTNPNSSLGFGTWAAFAAGRTPVAIDAGQTEFDTLRETGGAKTVTLATSELPSHGHTQDSHNHSQNSHNHGQDAHGHTWVDNGHVHVANLSSVSGTSVTRVREGGGGVATQVSLNSAFGSVTISTDTATNQTQTATNQGATATNQNTGGGGAHNNLQPYITVVMWERTA